jgi:hypothetical protein
VTSLPAVVAVENAARVATIPTLEPALVTDWLADENSWLICEHCGTDWPCNQCCTGCLHTRRPLDTGRAYLGGLQ